MGYATSLLLLKRKHNSLLLSQCHLALRWPYSKQCTSPDKKVWHLISTSVKEREISSLAGTYLCARTVTKMFTCLPYERNLYAPRWLLSFPGLKGALISISLFLARRVFSTYFQKKIQLYFLVRWSPKLKLYHEITWLLSRVAFIQSEEWPNSSVLRQKFSSMPSFLRYARKKSAIHFWIPYWCRPGTISGSCLKVIEQGKLLERCMV